MPVGNKERDAVDDKVCRPSRGSRPRCSGASAPAGALRPEISRSSLNRKAAGSRRRNESLGQPFKTAST